MNKRSHLVPTQITDANGKSTTVYRKPASDNRTRGKLPAPKAASKLGKEEALELAIGRLFEAGFLKSPDYRYLPSVLNYNLQLLSEHSPQALDELVTHIVSSDDVMRKSWEWTLISGNVLMPSDIEGKDAHRKVRKRYQRRMTIQPLIRSIQSHQSNESPDSATERVIYAIDEYVPIKADLELVWSISLCFGIRHLSEDIAETRHEDASAWASSFVYDHVEAVKPLVEELVARRSTDPELIEQLLTTHSALAEGQL